MIKIDMWYNDRFYDIDAITVYFYPDKGIYSGNLYSAGKPIGDYTSNNSLEIEKRFHHIFKF